MIMQVVNIPSLNTWLESWQHFMTVKCHTMSQWSEIISAFSPLHVLFSVHSFTGGSLWWVSLSESDIDIKWKHKFKSFNQDFIMKQGRILQFYRKEVSQKTVCCVFALFPVPVQGLSMKDSLLFHQGLRKSRLKCQNLYIFRKAFNLQFRTLKRNNFFVTNVKPPLTVWPLTIDQNIVLL